MIDFAVALHSLELVVTPWQGEMVSEVFVRSSGTRWLPTSCLSNVNERQLEPCTCYDLPTRFVEFPAWGMETSQMLCWFSTILATQRLERNKNLHLAGLAKALKRAAGSVN